MPKQNLQMDSDQKGLGNMTHTTIRKPNQFNRGRQNDLFRAALLPLENRYERHAAL